MLHAKLQKMSIYIPSYSSVDLFTETAGNDPRYEDRFFLTDFHSIS